MLRDSETTFVEFVAPVDWCRVQMVKRGWHSKDPPTIPKQIPSNCLKKNGYNTRADSDNVSCVIPVQENIVAATLTKDARDRSSRR